MVSVSGGQGISGEGMPLLSLAVGVGDGGSGVYGVDDDDDDGGIRTSGGQWALTPREVDSDSDGDEDDDGKGDGYEGIEATASHAPDTVSTR